MTDDYLKSEYDIYDFDKTIVPFESGMRFFLFCVCRYLWLIFYIPFALALVFLLGIKAISLKTFKRFFFGFTKLIPCERAVKQFWEKNKKHVSEWFVNRERGAVVISASPDFLLEEFKRLYNVEYLICTRYDKKSLKIIGENCRDDEKVKRLEKELPGIKIVNVYSDSLLHDRHIFALAGGMCYHIVNKECIPFKFEDKYGKYGEI